MITARELVEEYHGIDHDDMDDMRYWLDEVRDYAVDVGHEGLDDVISLADWALGAHERNPDDLEYLSAIQSVTVILDDIARNQWQDWEEEVKEDDESI